MPRPKITFFEIEDWEADYLKSKLRGFEVLFFKNKLDEKNFKKAIEATIISTFIYSHLNQKIISSLPNLKYITTRSTGFDHIDIKACREREILVSNVPTYGENTVAEHTFALILALSRKICQSWERARRGDFSLEGLRGFDLKGKTLGVIGTGHIGSHVVRIALGFEMKVLAFDVKPNKKLAKELRFKYVPFNYLLKNSDIVTLHVPYNKYTHHLINLNNLKYFKPGCYLINTARGEVCDTKALLKGIQNGIFAGLGLDVLEGECFVKEERELLTSPFTKKCDLKTALANHVLLKYPNVVITPHNAFNSQEALQRILETTVENITSFLKGKPINLV